MVTAITNRKVVYVGLVSFHNLAEFKAIKRLNPEQVVLVVTSKMKDQAQRLRSVLESDHINVVEFPSQQIGGEEGHEIMNLLVPELTTYLMKKQNQGFQCILNCTGATKILGILLERCFTWDEVHYIGNDTNKIEKLTYNGQRQSNIIQEPLDYQVGVFDHAALYTDKAKKKSKNNTVITKQAKAALSAAQYIHAQQIEKLKTGKNNCLTLLFDGIENHSIFRVNDENQTVQIDFDEPVSTDRLDEMIGILSTPFEALVNMPLLQREGDKVLIAANVTNKKVKHWQRFIEGEWFEYLIEHWLKQLFNEHEFGMSVQIHNDKESESGKDPGLEADFLVVNNKGFLNVLELKAGLKYNARGALNQVSKMSDRLGKINLSSFLVLAPNAYFDFRNDHARSQFIANAKVDGTNLILALSPEHFFAAINNVSKAKFPADNDALLSLFEIKSNS